MVKVSRRYVAYNEPVARFFHHQITATLRAVAGEPLKPSYVYLASYLSGAELKKHTDREQCEFSVTLCLDFSPEPELGNSVAHPSGYSRGHGHGLSGFGRWACLSRNATAALSRAFWAKARLRLRFSSTMLRRISRDLWIERTAASERLLSQAGDEVQRSTASGCSCRRNARPVAADHDRSNGHDSCGRSWLQFLNARFFPGRDFDFVNLAGKFAHVIAVKRAPSFDHCTGLNLVPDGEWAGAPRPRGK